MPQSPVQRFIRQLRDDVLPADRCTDMQLLDAYLAHGDDAAFETLVHRYGPMVFGVCCRVLRNETDAADAFQATFLVLIRKASALHARELLGNWLYGVALRTAMRARAETRKRQTRMRQVDPFREPQTLPQEPCRDLLEIMDREIARLPDKYRIPVILCELEGRSRQEVAKELQIPLGTLASRLANARKMLARRLARHAPGGTPGIMTLARRTSASPVPQALLQATFQNARTIANRAITAGSVSAKVVSLTEGVVRSMLMSRLKIALLVTGFIGLSAFGAGFGRSQADEPLLRDQQAQPNPTRQTIEEEGEILTRDAAKFQLPTGPAPLQAWARISGENQVFIGQYVTAYQLVQKPEIKSPSKKSTYHPKAGKKEAGSQHYYEPVVTLRFGNRELANVKAFDMYGKAVETAELSKRLKHDTLVLVAPNNKQVDPLHLRLFKDDTILLIFPEAKKAIEPPPAGINPEFPNLDEPNAASYPPTIREVPANVVPVPLSVEPNSGD